MGDIKSILGGLLVAGGICVAQAQMTVNISGVVTSSGSSLAVPGAKVFLAGNPSISTTTAANGTFTLTGTATVGLRGTRGAKPEMSMKGGQLSITVNDDNTPLSVDVYDLRNRFVRNLVARNASAGRYTVNPSAAGLRSGTYFVRARAGAQSSSFKLTTVGSNAVAGVLTAPIVARTALAKTAVDPIDSLDITVAGFKPFAKPITTYGSGIFTLLIDPKLTPGDLKIVSERNMPQVFWGKNVDVQVWDGFTQLKGDYKASSFEGGQSWLVNFKDGQPYSAWGFVSTVMPEDMGAWKGGTMHLAVRGTVSSIGVTMASADEAGGSSLKVDLANYGYKPMTSINDSAWHEVTIPMDDFAGVDFTQVNIYCGLVTPMESDTTPFDPTGFYLVDDIYWSLKK